MSYEKQNFADGQVLEAEHLNKMEDGIAKANGIIVTVGGDTLTWDGNTEGRYGVDMGDGVNTHFLVSKATPTIEDFANGATAIIHSELHIPLTVDMIQEVYDGILMCADGLFLVVQQSAAGVEIDGIVFDEAGVYLLGTPDVVVTSLTIPGYTGFTKEKIDPAFLPAISKLYTDGTYLYDNRDTSDATNRVSKDELSAYVKSNAVLRIDRVIDGAVIVYWASAVSIANSAPYGLAVVATGDSSVNLYTAEYTAS